MPSFELKTALFWTSAAVCFIAQAAIIRSAFRTPSNTQSIASKDTGATTPATPSRSLEIFWTILPALALTALLWATWNSII